jgi:hypothetical protein
MRIREFQHGTFTVLIVTPFDVSKGEINLPLEMAIKQERETLARTRRALHAHGGKLVDIFGPPVIALWPSPQKTPDRRALDSALVELVGAMNFERVQDDAWCTP